MNADGYAVLPLAELPAYPDPCSGCDGDGVTGVRYEFPTDTGPVLLCEVICPDCGGCGNGDPAHIGCPPDAHAYPGEFPGDPGDDAAYRRWSEARDAEIDRDNGDLDEEDDDAACFSCGSGRGWVTVQGFYGEGEDCQMVLLRVPCGCSTDRLEVTAEVPT
jgi:hypothetical protein